MYWMVRLDDQHGRFWMESDHKAWSDSVEDGHRFDKREDADQAAAQAQARVKSAEWFPRIKVVSFT